MTTVTFSQASRVFGTSSALSKPRSPRTSFAARLARLQARHELHSAKDGLVQAAIGGAGALLTVSSLTWMFVSL